MTTSPVAQILTRSAVRLLSEGLDAGDILECYALVRPASLHNGMVSDAGMTIHKVAIGLRYRPLTVNDPADEGKIREITLEYGPQRMGASLTQESVPSVQLEKSVGGGQEIADINITSARAFVTWENEGKVYYTTQIASAGYVGAYYMASVTGAVLGKILEKAVEYPMENAYIRGRPRRYQPFVVVDGKNKALPPPGYEGPPTKRKVLLRSSGSGDFMQYMWYTLAELGVSLHPILAPPTYEVQLTATDVEKVKVGPPSFVTQSAATFYTRLYQCIEAKVTGDYSQFSKPPTPAPTTASPAPSLSHAPSVTWIEAEGGMEGLPAEGNSGNVTDSSDNQQYSEDDDGRGLRADFPGTPEVMQTDPPIDALKGIRIHDDNSTSASAALGNDTIALPTFPPTNETNLDTSNVMEASTAAVLPLNQTVAPSSINLTLPGSVISANQHTISNISFAPTSSFPSNSPSIGPPSESPSVAPSVYKVNKQDTKTEVDNAQEAADVAKQAAAEAKDAAKTDAETKAADAAQLAAQAAQKAADATSNAAAQAAMDAFLSGDGSSIVSVLTPCFSDPQFGIAVLGENGTITSQAYLYIDGSSYYRVNLTYPFLQVAPVERTLPQPRDFASTASGGDVVDWTLALMLLMMFLLGVLMLVQQVFGGYVRLIRPLFDFQIWFFDPTHYDEKKERLKEDQCLRRGGGRAYSFGADAIPVSMGGKRTSHLQPPGLSLFRSRDEDEEVLRERVPLKRSGEDQEEGDGNEIELTEANSSPGRRSFDEIHRGTSRGSASSTGSCSSVNNGEIGASLDANGVVGNLELVESDRRIREKDLPSRLTRDPDLVDMPNLKSSSKVAVPVGVKHTRSKSFDNRSFESFDDNTL